MGAERNGELLEDNGGIDPIVDQQSSLYGAIDGVGEHLTILSTGGGRPCLPFASLAEHDLLWAHDREELADAEGQSFLDERVVDPIGVPALHDESGVLENPQMPGDRRGADGESGSDVACGELAFLEVLEDLTSRRVGESPEHASIVIHMLSLAIVLITIKPGPR